MPRWPRYPVLHFHICCNAPPGTCLSNLMPNRNTFHQLTKGQTLYTRVSNVMPILKWGKVQTKFLAKQGYPVAIVCEISSWCGIGSVKLPSYTVSKCVIQTVPYFVLLLPSQRNMSQSLIKYFVGTDIFLSFWYPWCWLNDNVHSQVCVKFPNCRLGHFWLLPPLASKICHPAPPTRN